MSLDFIKISYLDTLNQMSDLGPGIDPHIPMYLDPSNDVVLIPVYYHIAFKVEPLTLTRLMRGDEEPFVPTYHVIYIFWSQ